MNKALHALKAARSVVVTSHIQPDGDAVGATVALLRALKIMGKECRAISPSHIPGGFMFVLRDENEVVRYDPDRDDGFLGEADLFVIVDCSNLERAGEVGEAMAALSTPILVIDHHATNVGFGTHSFIGRDVASTGELLMDLFEALGLPISPEIAVPLYVAILTDTGGFNYPRTTKKTHRRAGELLAAGVKPFEIHRKLSLDRTLEFMRLAGLAVFNTNLGYGDEIAYSIIHNDIYRKFTPRVDELIMIPPYLTSIHGVEVGALFLEFEPGRIIVELRSKGLVDISLVATKFGGGGHSGAGGARLEGEMPGVVYRVLSEIEKLLVEARRGEVSEDLRGEVLSRT
ncbi:MAG: DHH family phosphoesterase [Candidatus Tritonobacter lacicola]|nr:DHH family phosphoesterase [Candidatus Tritonobacter lacicola]